MHPSISPSSHPSIHSPSPFLYASIPPSSVYPTIFPSIYPSIHSSIHLFIHPFNHLDIYQSTQPFIHLPTLASSNPIIHPPSHHHPSIHACSHLHIICWTGHPPTTPKHPLTLSSSPSLRPLFIHMLHFKMVNMTQSLSSQNLHVSDDHHNPRSTGLLLGQCLPNLAAPSSGSGHLQSKENEQPWMVFTLSLHLHNHISFSTSLISLSRCVKSQAGRCDTQLYCCVTWVWMLPVSEPQFPVYPCQGGNLVL